MSELKNKIVLVTGASVGIGAACARAFAAAGARILICARREDKLKTMAADLKKEFGTDVMSFPLDVRDRGAVEQALGGLPANWRSIEVLINNAGLSRGLDKLQDGKIDDWEEMIDTNVKGLLYVSRAVIPGMIERGSGHVINLGSIAGREAYAGGNVYCATKFAVKALSRCLRLDLNGTPIRVSEIAPGMVETEFSDVRFHGDKERAAKVYQGFVPLSAEDIADSAVWCATRPAHVNISSMVVMPTAQASATVTCRK